MAHLIRRGRIETANWRLLDEQGLRELVHGNVPAQAAQPNARIDGLLLPFPLWLAERAACAASGFETGVLVRDEDDLATLSPHLSDMRIAAVHFARFTQGRGYSIARILRGRYGYAGELRAIGDVLRDQMFYLHRVGFDAFELRADQDPEQALRALRDFSEVYQASTDRPAPLFQRRTA
jgi:uncharacterized protein (DUF934 family)